MSVHNAVMLRQVLHKVFNPFNKTLRQFSIVQTYINTRPGLVQSLGLMKQGKHERIFGI